VAARYLVTVNMPRIGVANSHSPLHEYDANFGVRR
jgi:hypothetical protein